MKFTYQDNSDLLTEQLNALAQDKKIDTEIAHIQQLLKSGLIYESEYASLGLLDDPELFETVQNAVEEKKKLNPTMIIVVGIGGSSLGAKAVYEALADTHEQGTTPLYFAETVDSDYLHTLFLKAQQELVKGNTIVVVAVTKSGTTLETMVNFSLFLRLLKKQRPTDFNSLIVVCTDKHSPLWVKAHEQQWTVLQIPKQVGGRFSVCSPAALFPLGMAGIAITQLCEGARQMRTECIQHTAPTDNPALLSALLQYAYYQKGYVISDLFLFSVHLEGMGKWYRQLMGESIGKECDRTGARVAVGITPTVSLGSSDLHSVVQLYLAGPQNRFTTFVTVTKPAHCFTVPQDILPGNKTVTEIMHALAQGTQNAYLKNNLPFCSVVLSGRSAYTVGQFLQFKMLEIMYLGFLFGINPFDQPHVELYKKEVQALLKDR